MRPQGTQAVVAAASFSTADPDAFASALLGGTFEYLPVSGERFSGSLRLLRLGDVVVQHAHDGAHITRAALDPGGVGLILPLGAPSARAIANGTPVERDDALLLPTGAEFCVTCPTSTEWASVLLPPGQLEELAELAPRPDRVRGTISLLGLPPAPRAALAAALSAAAGMASDLPAELSRDGVAESLAGSLQELIQATLTAGPTERPQRRATREAMRVLRGAEDFLRANLHRPVYRDELCATLGVSRRKLHDAFIVTVGMSPPAYLKMRRLTLARRALRAGGDGAGLVKSVALAHGFWHLGYFAQDYRALFGEAPSRTRAAGRKGGGADGVSPRLMAVTG